MLVTIKIWSIQAQIVGQTLDKEGRGGHILRKRFINFEHVCSNGKKRALNTSNGFFLSPTLLKRAAYLAKILRQRDELRQVAHPGIQY